jgi:DNA-binding winged helix-turn-helix (wHTH) protein
VIDPLIDPDSRRDALRLFFGRVRFGQCAAIVGLNDVGKTTLFGLAQLPEVAQRYGPAGAGGGVPLLAVVDCNHLAPPSERELYAVMARGIGDAAGRAGKSVARPMVDAYLASTRLEDRASAVPPALELEALLVRLVQELGLSIAVLFDEFDTMYRRMEAGIALALRAFHNRLGPALSYVVAVDQPLERVREGLAGDAGDAAEFEELFVNGSQTLPLLSQKEAQAFVERYFASRTVATYDWVPPLVVELTAGHSGLLWAACAAVQRLSVVSRGQLERDLLASPEVRNECENVWRRLPAAERLAVEAGGRTARADAGELLDGLRGRGLLGPAPSLSLAIPCLEHFLARSAPPVPAGITVNAQTGEVAVNGAPPISRLGPTEFRLLQLLYERGGALVTKDEIARAVWPQEERLSGVDDARIDKLVDRVRSKIEPNPHAPRFLVTVRGLGYRLLANG